MYLHKNKMLSPSGRLGDPQEIRHLAFFLASDLARYISGSAISINAGSSAGKLTPSLWSHPEILVKHNTILKITFLSLWKLFFFVF
jgi:Enoyl-(Acyl carrier protein) reductase